MAGVSCKLLDRRAALRTERDAHRLTLHSARGCHVGDGNLRPILQQARLQLIEPRLVVGDLVDKRLEFNCLVGQFCYGCHGVPSGEKEDRRPPILRPPRRDVSIAASCLVLLLLPEGY
jgi:hypothetical protein